MAVVTWVGGTHKATDPAAWSPNAPESDDVGIISSGNAVAVGLTLNGYTLSIGGPDYFPGPTLDLFQSTLGPQAEVFSATNPIPDGYPVGPGLVGATLAFLGTNSVLGGMVFGPALSGTGGPYVIDVHDVIDITDVVSKTDPAIAVQAGKLTSTGLITVVHGADLLIQGGVSGTSQPGSVYAQFVNNGAVSLYGASLTANVAMTGTGAFSTGGDQYVGQSRITLNNYVGSNQTFELTNTFLSLNDPSEFYGTIAGFVRHNFGAGFDAINIKGTVTRGNFDGSILTLYNGDTLIAHLKFAGDLTAGDFLVNSLGGSTDIEVNYSDTSGPIPISSGTGPVIVDPGSPTLTSPRLPGVSTTAITLLTDTRTLTQGQIDGYTVRLEGVSLSATLPAVSMTFGSIGGRAEILAGDMAGNPHFGRVNAVGYNENHGVIAAEGAGSTSHNGSVLTLGIENVLSPDAVLVQPGVFVNSGTMSAHDGGVITIMGDAGSKLINTGTISALSGGSVFIGTTLTQTGSVLIDHASLETGGSVSTGQSVDLKTGVLTIDDVKDFAATIYDFNVGSQINLVGTPGVDSLSYVNGRLSLLASGKEIGALHFHCPAGVFYDTASFHLTASSSGAPASLTVTPH